MYNKIAKISSFIKRDITCLNYTNIIENLLFDVFEDKSIFYTMMMLYEKSFVSDLIFKGFNIACENLKNTNIFISDKNKACLEYWKKILTDEIISNFKNSEPLKRETQLYKGKIYFSDRPKKDNYFDGLNYSEKKGYYGELEIYRELKTFYNPNYLDVLYGNYNIKFDDNFYSFQSDFLVISDFVIFVIEVKNWSGSIEIDEIGNCITNGEFRSNPISQNNRHVNDIRKFLLKNFDIDIPIIPITVFTSKAHIINISNEYKEKIVNFDDLNRTISDKIDNFMNDENSKLYSARIISNFINFNKFKIYKNFYTLNYNLINEHHAYLLYNNSIKYKSASKTTERYNLYSINEQDNSDLINVGICFDNSELKSFSIKGIRKTSKICELKYASFFAVIYNLLIKKDNIDSSKDMMNYFKKIAIYNLSFDIRENYSKIIQHMFIILLLIKHNNYNLYDDNNIELEIRCTKNEEEIFDLAVGAINYFLEKLSLLSLEKKIVISLSKIVCDKTNSSFECSFMQKKVENKLWIEKNIIYNINENNKHLLVDILHEISEFDDFRVGQLNALIEILNSSNNKIVVMPTGSGKSLVYFMSTILQPKFSVIISPTTMLINNQIFNLNKKHKFTNVDILDEKTNILNKHLIYATPSIFDNDNIVRYLISNKFFESIYSFILDEAHCLSFKSHSFNPQYFTLSSKLNNFFKRSIFIGFTATSEFDVAKDLVEQLNVKDEDVISPINLRTDRLKYNIFRYHESTDLDKKFIEIYNNVRHEKSLVFVKDNLCSKKIFDLTTGEDTLIFDENDELCVDLFLQEDSGYNVLICHYDIGIGIDFGNVRNIIHYGIPYSKMDFVQQVGRAGRNGEHCTSYVLYIDNSKINKYIFDRTIGYKNLFDLVVNDEKNDYTLTYLYMFNNFINLSYGENKFIDLYNEIILNNSKGVTSFEIKNDIDSSILYMLQTLGLIEYWATVGTKVLICIPKDILLSNIKNKFRKYLKIIGNNKLNSMIVRLNNMKELVLLFYDNFIDSYVQMKKNQFYDLVDFLNDYCNKYNSSTNINDELAEYFNLPFEHLVNLDDEINNLNLFEINNRVLNNEDSIHDIINFIERFNVSSTKINYLKLLKEIFKNQHVKDFSNRIKQIIVNINDNDIYTLFFNFNEILNEYNIIYRNDYLIELVIIIEDNLKIEQFIKLCEKYIDESNNEELKLVLISKYINKYFGWKGK